MTTARLKQHLLSPEDVHENDVSMAAQNTCVPLSFAEKNVANPYLNEILDLEKTLLLISEFQTLETLVLELALHTQITLDRTEHLAKMYNMLSFLIDKQHLHPKAEIADVAILKNTIEKRLETLLSIAQKRFTPDALRNMQDHIPIGTACKLFKAQKINELQTSETKDDTQAALRIFR